VIAAVFGRNLLMNQGSPFAAAPFFYNNHALYLPVGAILT
jgi:hypothetical protein